VAKYSVKFQPTSAPPAGDPTPVVLVQNQASKVSTRLPSKLASGTYSVVWTLIGNPGDSAPGTIVANVAKTVKTKKKKKSARTRKRQTAAAPPPAPIGVDAGGKPIKIVTGAAHDVIRNYTLP
jgi:hypothetical protein